MLIENLLERDPEWLLVAERAGEANGTAITDWDGWRAHQRTRLCAAVSAGPCARSRNTRELEPRRAGPIAVPTCWPEVAG